MGLGDSAFEPEPQLMRNLAKAYMWTYDGRTFEAPTFQLGIGPAGCLYTSVTDLGRFLSILFARGRGPNGPVLKPETLEQMWQPQFAKPGDTTGFGIGFRLSKFEGHRMVGHGGAIYGFATALAALPDDKVGVVAVTTMSSSNAVVNHIAHEGLRLMLAARAGRPLTEIPVTQPVNPAVARRMDGRHGQGSKAIDLIERAGKLYYLPVRGGERIEVRQAKDASDPRWQAGLRITNRSGERRSAHR